ncbi:MAG: hypothetical protein H7263_14195 [Candidatus Sericytochromatia bacterium]|nr:hypothetical protein [Candidatus Sericytochromatia bacterium]
MKIKLSLLVTFLFISSCQLTNNITTNTPTQTDNISSQKNLNNQFESDLFIAQSDARRWDISANLVRAEANWINEDGYVNWTYYFKSPFKRNAFRHGFSGFGEEVPDNFFGTEIRSFDIRINSSQAIQKAKTQGLKNFPISQMILEKKFGYAEWEIDSSNGIFRVNAENSNISVIKK